ncbi:MAG: hypothetical protein AB7U95_16055 [Reyranella sp.]
MTEQPQDGEPLGNSERLKAHLEADSLAAAFLDAWFKPGTPQERQARLLAALDAHGSTESVGNAPASAE